MKKVLLFSSVCKDVSILELVLPSWQQQHTDVFQFDLLIYNDNKTAEAKAYTKDWVDSIENATLLPEIHQEDSVYKDHAWTKQSIDRIISIKNAAIQYALDQDYDGLFLVDADLILHPDTLYHLISLEKDFVFEIFWTVFTDQLFAKPNCWDVHSWDYYNANSILSLKEKGTYKVGAGGACTLLSRSAMQKGLDFSRIKNMPFAGEDRHICTRAEVLGIDIFVDTYFPAFHVFKDDLIPVAHQWLDQKKSPEFFQDWLNESWREQVIKYTTPTKNEQSKNKLQKVKKALYKAKRAYINYMRYN